MPIESAAVSARSPYTVQARKQDSSNTDNVSSRPPELTGVIRIGTSRSGTDRGYSYRHQPRAAEARVDVERDVWTDYRFF